MGSFSLTVQKKASTMAVCYQEEVDMMADKKAVGKRIMVLRKEQGYSREVFAGKLGIPPTTLRNYELGIHEPGHSFIIQMAKEFSVSTDYLLGLSEDRKPAYPTTEDDTAVSEAEMAFLQAFRRLDAHGKRVVRWLLAEEGLRIAAQNDDDE